MIIDQHTYRKAFQEYLRKGTPIMWSIKQDRPTTHYIWRTRNDNRVRGTHAEREGEIFSWDNPPPGGHPGEDYGCRCTAEPYIPEQSEFMSIDLNNVSNSGSAWSSIDFVRHYYRGNGRGVTVRQTGHLTEIVGQYMSEVEKRLKEQIAREARNKRNGNFSERFYNTYGMTGVVFSIGDTVIGGVFNGFVQENNGILKIEGAFDFYLTDEFADPADIGVEVVDPTKLGEMIYENIHRPLDNYLRGRVGLPASGSEQLGVITGDPYPITDKWSGELRGEIYLDASRSAYA